MTYPNEVLATGRFKSWTVASLRDSIGAELKGKNKNGTLRMFFYAVTQSGWAEIKGPVCRWMRQNKANAVVLYAGTDHGLTDPAALWAIKEEGVEVRIMNKYQGVFHPKVMWLTGDKQSLVWVASNNLTRGGLINNIEFAALIRATAVPRELTTWAKQIHEGSIVLTKDVVDSYKRERKAFQARMAKAKAVTFTWSKKVEPEVEGSPLVNRGDLVLEVMPEETRGGNQVQVPREAAKKFFGLKNVGDHRTISLTEEGKRSTRDLILTVFSNNTVRVSINELEYDDRPCVIVFRKLGRNSYSFQIVSESTFPSKYRALIEMCKQRTRSGSRRWTIKL